MTTTTATIRPLEDAAQLAAYIDEYWAKDHILARDPRMLQFTYGTPWVDRERFPAGLSVLGTYADDGRLIGFLGAIVTPYPRPQSYWLALWHVLPELKGTGMGGRLLREMMRTALDADGWIGTFGAGPDAWPVYLKREFAVRAVRRWVYAPDEPEPSGIVPVHFNPVSNVTEVAPDDAWFEYRYNNHPVWEYDRRDQGVFRTEDNDWGHVTHAVWLAEESDADVAAVYAEEQARAEAAGRPYLLDAWSMHRPGDGWRPADNDLPSVFHPPEARGALVYAVGYPFLPRRVQKGDCDQDRPN